MKILFAAPDRDLLECCKKLLETDCGETVTAFDGTQVLYMLEHESFDIVILDRDIPRIDYRKIISRIHEKELPVILLIDEPVSARQLTEEALPTAYLSYPFTSGQLGGVIQDITEKLSSGENLDIFGTEIIVSEFRLAGGCRLTVKEIDVLRSLLCGEHVTTSDGAYISALNEKFTRTGSKARIRYMTGNGFELVAENE